MNSEQILELARAGDGEAFRRLTEPYRRELEVHCYRMLGSIQDAEDLLQETLLAAWRGLDGFQARSSLRTWLYRIATNRCLNALRDGARRPAEQSLQAPEVVLPEPTRNVQPSWLEPFPDLLLDQLPDTAPGPEARYQSKEAISLAFLAAVQLLPPRQRAVLILRDVLGYRASEVADMLGRTQDSVNSALKRARGALTAQLPDNDRDRAPLPNSPTERHIVERFTQAFENADISTILALCTDDVWLTMPPLPMQYRGLTATEHFLATISFREGRRYQLVPTRANGQPAFGCYLRDPRTPILHPHGLLVLTLIRDKISVLSRFIDNGLLTHFGLPRSLRG